MLRRQYIEPGWSSYRQLMQALLGIYEETDNYCQYFALLFNR